jgi:uncharacterized protein DUF3572
MKAGAKMTEEAAEALAIQALSFIAGDGDRLGRFLAITGIGPAEIRTASGEPGFLAGVLDYVAGDERMVVEFASELKIDPSYVGIARAALGGGAWEREVP